jgi:hypothetical protein
MGYIKINWPESQMIMELSEEEMDDYGIELGDDCSYFVPEEDYDEVYALAEERMRQSIEGDDDEYDDELDGSKVELPWSYGKHFD